MAMVVVRRRGVLTLWQSETDASEQYAISPELLAPSENGASDAAAAADIAVTYGDYDNWNSWNGE